MGAPTPILAAVYGGQTDALAALLAQRPKLTVCDAAAVGDPALLREALRTDAAGVAGRSPGNLALINVLLAHGAAAEARTDDGRTALASAEKRGHAYAARRLRGELP